MNSLNLPEASLEGGHSAWSYPQKTNLLQKALGSKSFSGHFVGRRAFHHTPLNKQQHKNPW